MTNEKYSIIIPTCNHLDDCLRPCLKSLIKYTSFENKEIVVICNGCTDGTREYLDSLKLDFLRYIWFDEPLGCSGGFNIGVENCDTEYIIYLNNDVIFLDQPKNQWLNLYLKELTNSSGIVGHNCIASDFTELGISKSIFFVEFYCVLFKKSIYDEIGGLDKELLSCTEDCDWCIRLKQHGYSIAYTNKPRIVHKGRVTRNDLVPMETEGISNINLIKKHWSYLMSIDNIKYSIVIPTYNHLEDALRPCMESILRHMDIKNNNIEFIIVCNGCNDGTVEYLNSIKSRFHRLVILEYNEPLGYTKSTNLGIQQCNGEYVVLLNNDITITGYDLLNRLETPFKDDPYMGITGCHMLHCDHADRDFLLFYCVMIKRKVIEEVGLLNEVFNPGGGEDTDYCARLQDLGYKMKLVCDMVVDDGFYRGDFPINHTAEVTVEDNTWWEWNDVLTKNRNTLKEMYGENYAGLEEYKTYSLLLFTCKLNVLRESLESILKYTDVGYNVRLVIVLNACKEECIPYIQEMSNKYKSKIDVVCINELKPYSEAVNIAVSSVKSDYYVLLNDDIALLPQEKNHWLKLLQYPFSKSDRVGMTGPKRTYINSINCYFLEFFCVMIKKEVFDRIGLMDTEFGKWHSYCDDIDFGYRATMNYFKLVEVPTRTKAEYKADADMSSGDFPIYHRGGEQSTETKAEYVRGALSYLLKKHIKGKSKLQVGCGGKVKKGYLNVDLVNPAADMRVDMTDLSIFEDNMFDEIIGIHTFEHINPHLANSTLHGFHRVLVPNGKLILEMPNIRICAEKYLNAKTTGDKYVALTPVYGAMEEGSHQKHMYGWDEDTISEHLGWNGFKDIEAYTVKEDLRAIAICNKDMTGDDKSEQPNSVDPIKYMVDNGEKTREGSLKEFNDYIGDVSNETLIEVGVFKGASTKQFALKFNNVIGIDPWKNYYDPDDPLAFCDMEEVRSSYLQLMDLNPNVTIIEEPSIDACKHFKDGQCYAVYLDACHKYESVKQDIEHWLKKVRDDGFISGHDYNDVSGVKQAVHELLGEPDKVFSDTSWIKYKKNINYKNTDEEDDSIMFEDKLNVTATVCTKDRYDTTLSHTLMAIMNQTHMPREVIVFDDSTNKRDMRDIPIYDHILKMMTSKRIFWRVEYSDGTGQVFNHNRALDMAQGNFIWRLDDDNVPEPDVLDRLADTLQKTDADAVGGLVIDPKTDYDCKPRCASNRIEHIYRGMNIQWFKHDTKEPIDVDHLYSSFLFRKKTGKKIGYCKELSKIGHREETIFTYSMKRAGYKLIVDPNAVTWHMTNPEGGLRSTPDGNPGNDERIFKNFLSECEVKPRHVKLIVLDNGIGDHFCFKNILEDIKRKYSRDHDILIASCYEDVFFDVQGIELMSLREAKRMVGNIDNYNIYKYCLDNNWKERELVEAFKEVYL